VLDLSLHSDAEEGDEVHDEDRPEDRDVENLEKGTAESDHRGLGRRVPELELWQTPDERAEFFILRCWQARRPILILLHLHHGGINLWCEERQQQVQMVDGQRICHNIPTLCENNPGAKADDKNDCRDPARCSVG